MSLSPIQLMAQLTSLLTGNTAPANCEAAEADLSSSDLAGQFSSLLNQALDTISPKPETPAALPLQTGETSGGEIPESETTETSLSIDVPAATQLAAVPYTAVPFMSLPPEQPASGSDLPEAVETGVPDGPVTLTEGAPVAEAPATFEVPTQHPSELAAPKQIEQTTAEAVTVVSAPVNATTSETQVPAADEPTVSETQPVESEAAEPLEKPGKKSSVEKKPAEDIATPHGKLHAHAAQPEATSNTPEPATAQTPPAHAQSVQIAGSVAASHANEQAVSKHVETVETVQSSAPQPVEQPPRVQPGKGIFRNHAAQFDAALTQASSSSVSSVETTPSLITELTENFVPDATTSPATPLPQSSAVPPVTTQETTDLPASTPSEIVSRSENPDPQTDPLPLSGLMQPADNNGRKPERKLETTLKAADVSDLKPVHDKLKKLGDMPVEIMSNSHPSPENISSETAFTLNTPSTETSPESQVQMNSVTAPVDNANQPTHASSNAANKNIFTASAGDIADQVIEGTSHGIKNGQRELTIRLNPDNLGEVRVSFVSHSSQHNTPVISARLIASTPESHEALQTQIQTLRNSLEAQGVQVDRISVILAGQAENSNEFSQQFNQNNGHQHQPQHNRQEASSQQQQHPDQNPQNFFANLGQHHQGRHHQYAQAPGLARYNLPSASDTPRDVTFNERSQADDRRTPHDNGNISLLA